MKSRVLVIVAFLIITLAFLVATVMGSVVAQNALPWITSAVLVELANLVRKEDP